MELSVGTIVNGKVTGITKFGAFVALEGGKSGLVHISEVANAFVSDVHDFLAEGQEVKVKILSVADGKISLSVKQAQEEKLQRERKRQQAVLRIKHKYGKNAILKGMNLEEGATAKDRNSQVGGHKA